MILITIDEMQGEKAKRIEKISGRKVYLLHQDKDIPYEHITIMITYGLTEDWEVLDRLTHLNWIQIFQTGIEHVPLKRIEERNIILTNVRNIYGTPMAEHVMSLILYEVRDLGRFIQNQKLKKYDREQLVDEVNKKTIGIFGTGAVGKEVAKKAQAFDMHVLGLNTTGKSVEYFDKTYPKGQHNYLLENCDFIVLLLPLVEDTYHFISERELGIMKKEAYLINIGRGPLIDEEALLKALRNNEIKGAALDVFDEEPLPKSSPLWEAENLILTPHLSGKTKYFFDRSITIFEENFAAFRRGEPLRYEIDFNKGY